MPQGACTACDTKIELITHLGQKNSNIHTVAHGGQIRWLVT